MPWQAIMYSHSVCSSLKSLYRFSKALIRHRLFQRRQRREFRRVLLEVLEDRRVMARQVAGTLSANDTWSGTIQVTGDVTVPTGIQLTISPGTVVKFDTGQALRIGAGSTFQAIGTAVSPITFTSTQDDTVGEDLTGAAAGAPQRGHWEAIYVGTNAATLEHVQVRYAGNTNNPGNTHQPFRLAAIEFAPDVSAVLRNVTLTDADWTGINVQGNATLDTVHIERTSSVAITQRSNLSPTYNRLTAVATGGNHVQLYGDTITSNQTWAFGGLPAHLATDLTLNSTLTLLPGTVIKVPVGRFIYEQSGSLRALGTATQPIVFTSEHDDSIGGDSNANGTATQGGPGQWEALYLRNSASTLDYVEVRYAGNVNNPGHSHEPFRVPGVVIQNNASPTLKNTRIRDSENIGLQIDSGSPILDGVSIERSGRRAIFQATNATPEYSSVALSGNAQNHIGLQAGTVTGGKTWDFKGLPVHVVGGDLVFDPSSNVTLVAGTILKLEIGAYLHSRGVLKSNGTQANPVIFTSNRDDSVGGDSNGDGAATSAGPGQWESLYIDSSTTELDFTEIRYAGNVANPGHTHEPFRVPAVQIRGNIAPQIRSSRIAFSENIGLQSFADSKAVLHNLRVESSGREAIYQELTASPTYTGVVLRGNRGDRITFAGGTIIGTRTLDFQGLPVHLTTDLIVGADAVVNIAAGSILKFPTGAYLHAPGTLRAIGTPEQPIVFTSVFDDTIGGDSNSDLNNTSGAPGQWESFYVDSSTSIFNNIEVRYAGNAANPGHTHEPFRVAAINVRNASSPTIKNARIRFSENVGLRMDAGTGPILESLIVENSGREAISQALSSDAVYAGVTALGNAANRVTLEGGTTTGTRAFDFNGLPIHLTSDLVIRPDASLTLAPGTVFKFPQGAYLHASGKLNANGTAAMPIIFTSVHDDSAGGDSNGNNQNTTAGPGQWESIYVDSSASVLNHVEIRYAGNDANPGHTHEPFRVAAVNVRNSSAPSIRNTRIRFGENIGLRMQADTSPLLENLVVENSGREAISQAVSSSAIYAGVVATGNAANRVTLDSGTITGTRTFDFNGLPVHVTGDLTLQTDASLTLVPGTVLKFPQGAYFDAIGRLSATGTAAQPIIFTSVHDDSAGGDSNGNGQSTSAAPGQWESLYIGSSTSTLKYLDIRYAGNVANPGHTHEPFRVAAVHIRNGADPSIDRIRILNAENDGVAILSGETVDIANSQFIGIGRTAINVISGGISLTDSVLQGVATGVRVASGQTASGRGNALVGVGTGVRQENTDASRAQFESNWWGSAGGPHDPSNVDGIVNANPTGTLVTDYVRYGNWLTTPPTSLRLGPAVESFRYLPVSNQLIVNFRQPISTPSFTSSDISISGPSAPGISGIQALNSSTYVVSLSDALVNGTYSLSIGPDVHSLSGIAMDQNENGIPGESGDTFTASLAIDRRGPYVIASSPVLGSTIQQATTNVVVTFNEPVLITDLRNVRLIRPDLASVLILGAFPLPNNQVRFNFAPQAANGVYSFNLPASAVVDLAGNFMDQNQNGISGETTEPSSDNFQTTYTVARESLRIVAQQPATSTNDAIENIEVTFSAPILATTFSAADVGLVGPLGSVPALGVTKVTDTRYRIAFQRATADGKYELTVGPAITDLAGIAMDQDLDGNNGELDDRYRSVIQLAGAGPQITQMSPRAATVAPVSNIEVTFSEPVDFASFTPIDVAIVGPSGSIPATAVERVSDTVARVRFAQQTVGGNYSVRIGPNVADSGGTLLDQDQDGINGEAIDDVFSRTFSIDAGGPFVTSAVPTGGINTPFDVIDFTFSEAIDPTSLTIDDMKMIGPAGTISNLQLVLMDSNKLRVRVPLQSSPGTYTITLGPNVTDMAGNAMDSNQNGIFGELADKFTNTIALALPDLVIDSAAVPAAIDNGAAFEVTYTVKNLLAGKAAAPWTDRIVFSKDRFYGNSDDILLDAFSRTTDMSGETGYTRMISARAPYGVTGEVRVFIVTDAGETVIESSEENNRAERLLTVNYQRPPADLVVDAINVTGPIGRGTEFPLSFRVRNDGLATTEAAAWTDEVFLSRDASLDGTDRRLATFRREGKLQSGATYSHSRPMVMPEDISIGDYFFIVRTDALNEAVEPAAEDNNLLASTSVNVTVRPLADLVIESVAPIAGSSLQSGEKITIEWSGKNTGSLAADGSWSDRIFLSTDNVLSANDINLGQTAQTRSLAVNGVYTSQLTTKLPEAISGTYFLIAVPDATNSVREGDGETTGTSHSAALSIALYPYADLAVKNVTAPPLTIGDPVDLVVSWTVENVGAGSGRVSTWNDRIVLSRNSTLGDGDDLVLGQFAHSGAMPSGTSYERREVIPLPIATNGRFTLFVHTDADNEVYELSGDQSNVGSPNHPVDVTTRPYADLVVDDVSVPAIGRAGEVIEVAWTVRNQGIAVTETSSWTDNIYISNDPTGASGYRYVGGISHAGPLAVDSTYTQNLKVTIPRDVSGSVYAFVTTGGPYEFIYTDNNRRRSAPVDIAAFVPPVVDLRGTLTNPPSRIFDGQQLAVSWTIINDGPQDLPDGWTDRLYLVSVNNPSTSIPLATFTHGVGLAAGKSISRTELVRFPRDLGQYRLVVSIDDGKSIVESSELNNLLQSDPFAIEARPRADLRAVNLEAPASVTSGTVIDFAFRVRNDGTADTPTGASRWFDEVWLSSTANPSGRFLQLKRLSNGSALSFPGSPSGGPTEYRTESSAALPLNLGGNLYLVAIVDVDGQVDEWPSEDNNYVAKSIAIDRTEIPPPDLVTDSVNAPTDAFDRNNITVRWKVANRGAGPTHPGSWTDSVWLTKAVGRPNSRRGDILLGNIGHSGVLQIGQAYESSVNLGIPAGTQGAYFVTVYSDSHDNVYEEAFESNLNPDAPNDIDSSNFRSVPINILLSPPADLVVTNVVAPSSAKGGQIVTLNWTVTNRGAVVTDRERWADAVYVSMDDKLDNSDTLVFALPHVGALQVGETYSQEATFTLPPSALGSHFIVATKGL